MSYLGTPPNSPMVNLVGLVLGDTPAVPVVAEKVAFTSELKGFDPLPFSPEHMARASHSPSDLVGRTEDAKPRMKPPDSVSSEQRRELLALGFRWDRVSRLYLALPQKSMLMIVVTFLFGSTRWRAASNHY